MNLLSMMLSAYITTYALYDMFAFEITPILEEKKHP